MTLDAVSASLSGATSAVHAVLRQCALFATLPESALHELEVVCRPLSLRGGERLLRRGEPSTHLHIVAVGRLRALREDGSPLAEITRFEPVGEMGALTGDAHGNDVEALRDSLLLRIGRGDLLAFVQRWPAALLAMSQIMLRRLRADPQRLAADAGRRVHSIALIAADASVDLHAIAYALETALRLIGQPVERIGSREVEAALGAGIADSPSARDGTHVRLTEWLAARERGGAGVLYVATGGATAGEAHWRERCLRQADRVLVCARAKTPPAATASLSQLRELQLRAPVHVALLRTDGTTAGDALGWRRLTGASAHHFVDAGSADDFQRLARQLTGRALGLVLGGGGARGFAHVGLLRAMEQLALAPDLVGGASMGAFFGALIARGADSRELRRLAHESFVARNHLNDFMLPRVALIRGRRFLAQLRRVFGEACIEALPRPYFCVSTNLTRGVAMCHEDGPLATWVGTSMAVPGVVPPVVLHGELLADGAIVNSLPTDLMQSLGRGPMLASDVSTEGSLRLPGVEGPDADALLRRAERPDMPRLVDILFRSATLTSESGVRARAARADLYLRMPVTGVGLFDWKRLDELIERGYRHAMESLPDALERLRGNAPRPPA